MQAIKSGLVGQAMLTCHGKNTETTDKIYTPTQILQWEWTDLPVRLELESFFYLVKKNKEANKWEKKKKQNPKHKTSPFPRPSKKFYILRRKRTLFLIQFFSYPKTLRNHFQTLCKYYVLRHLVLYFLERKWFSEGLLCAGLFSESLCMPTHFILTITLGSVFSLSPFYLEHRMMQWMTEWTCSRQVSAEVTCLPPPPGQQQGPNWYSATDTRLSPIPLFLILHVL